MKKLIVTVIMLAFIISVGVPTPVHASTISPIFIVDGRTFHTPTGEPAPYLNKDNRTMGSIRLVGNALGVADKNIKWDSKTETATMTKGDKKVEVTVGKKVMKVNGVNVTMDTLAEKKQGRVFIPVRFIAKGLGVNMQYDTPTATLHLFTKKLEDLSMDNFDDLGLRRLEKLPISMTTPDGLKLTVHSAYIYKTSDKAAKDLDKKYDFWDFENATDLLWMSVTLENTGKKRISKDYRDMLQKISVSYGMYKPMKYTVSDLPKHDKLNNSEVLWSWVLEPGEKITSNAPFLKMEKGNIDLIEINVNTNAGSDFKVIVEK